MPEMKTKTIDGESYEFGTFMTGMASESLIELLDMLGVTLPELFAVMGKGSGDGLAGLLKMDTSGLDLTKVGSALALLFSRMRERNATNLIKKFMTQVIHTNAQDGKPGCGEVVKVFDVHFQGRLLHMYKVFVAAVEVQYKDFFDALGGAEGIAKKVATAWGSQTSQDGNGLSSDQ